MKARILVVTLLALAPAACADPPTVAPRDMVPSYDGTHTIGSGNRSDDSTAVNTSAGNETTAGSDTESAAGDSSATGLNSHTIGSGN